MLYDPILLHQRDTMKGWMSSVLATPFTSVLFMAPEDSFYLEVMAVLLCSLPCFVSWHSSPLCVIEVCSLKRVKSSPKLERFVNTFGHYALL